MLYTHDGYFILRTPLLPYRSFSEEEISCIDLSEATCTNLISSTPSDLSNAVAIAAPNFFKRLLSGQAESSEKVHDASWRYVRRSCTRSTPFGFFAASTTGSIGANSLLCSDSEPARRFWGKPLDRLSPGLDAEILLNPTLYQSGGGYHRYYRLTESKTGGDVYELVELAGESGFSLFVQGCRDVDVLSQVKAKEILCEHGLCSIDEATEYLDELIDIGLLLRKDALCQLVYHKLDPVKSVGEIGSNSDFWSASRDWPFCAPMLSSSVVAQIVEALEINARDYLDSNSYCSQLSIRFRERFGERRVPLLQALDPLDGVFPEEVGALAKFLREFGLESEAISIMPSGDRVEAMTPPKLISIGFSLAYPRSENQGIADEAEPLIFIQGIDSSSGIGLFALPSIDDPVLRERIRGTMERFAHQESTIYAEVVHAPTKKSKSICRRLSVLQYEIQLFARGSAGGSDVIGCDELELTVEGSNVYLWCERLNSKIVPCSSTPITCENASLPLFNFFWNFQHANRGTLKLEQSRASMEGAVVEFTAGQLRWRKFERLQHKRVVLRPKRWWVRLDSPIDFGASLEEWAASFFEKLELPECVGIVEAGTTFEVRRSDMAGMRTLRGSLRRDDWLVLQESIVIEYSSPVKFPSGMYANEIILPLVLNESQHSDAEKPTIASPTKVEIANEFDASNVDSVYFSVYVGRHVADEIILYWHSQFSQLDCIRGWFFSRYTDPFFHIKLRVFFHAPQRRGGIESLLLGPYQDACWRLADHAGSERFEVSKFGGVDLFEVTQRYFCSQTAAICDYKRMVGAECDSPIEVICSTIALLSLLAEQFDFGKKRELFTGLAEWAASAARKHGRIDVACGAWWRIDKVKIQSRVRHYSVLGMASLQLCRDAAHELVGALAAVPEELFDRIVGRHLHLAANRYIEEDSILCEAVCYEIVLRLLRVPGPGL